MTKSLKRKLEESAVVEEDPDVVFVGDAEHLERLQLDHLSGTLLSTYHVAEAAELGRLKCLEYLFVNACPWDHSVWQTAAASGHLDCLKYIFKQIPQWYTFHWNAVHEIDDTNIDCFLFAVQHMKAANKKDKCWEKALLYNGAHSLGYARSKGLPLHSQLYHSTAAKGDLEAFQCLHELECPWDETLCADLIKHRGVEFVKFAHQHHCPWSADACTTAAENNRLDCLKYLKEHGCAWDENTFKKARENNSQECVQYLREQECPGSATTHF